MLSNTRHTLLPLGRDHARDVKQRIRKHVAGARNLNFESQRRNVRTQHLSQADRLLDRSNRGRFGIAAQLEQDILDSHSLISSIDLLLDGA
jgi:hypothetical protein